MKATNRESLIVRHRRIRARVHGTKVRPRLSLARSHRYLQAQLIDDSIGETLLGMSDKNVTKKEHKTQRARQFGMLFAKEAKVLGVRAVVFDRGGHKYHGRIKTFAEGAREGGLAF